MVNQKLEVKSDIYDVLVIGAGPHSLAVCSRLLERNPSAIYTDLEHSRLSWLHKYKRLSYHPKGFKRKLLNNKNDLEGLKMIALDKHNSGGWMPHWRTMFENLEIRSLRSPMFFHSSPADVDALTAYAISKGREKELEDIPGVVGKELTKHAKKRLIKTGKRPSYEDPINERYRYDFRTPGSKVFFDFCKDDIEDYYGLSQTVKPGEVSNLIYDYVDDEANKIFTVKTRDGREFKSRSVVVAIGNNTIVNLPDCLRNQPDIDWTKGVGVEGRGWCHTSAFARPNFEFPTMNMKKNIASGKNVSLVVIGGGLTSAQVIDKAYRNGVNDITLICRSHLKMKPFDFDTEWVDKFQNLSKMIFWREEDRQCRFDMIKKARNGGSVNFPYHKILKDLEYKGVLKIKTCTEVIQANYSKVTGWKLKSQTQHQHQKILMEELNNVDYLVSATGSKVDIDDIGFMKDFKSHNPIETCNGLPLLTEDLQWDEDIPLFMIGGFAALELGPDSYNLGGARSGAERIANRMNQMFKERYLEEDEQNDKSFQWMERLALNQGNYYEILSN